MTRTRSRARGVAGRTPVRGLLIVSEIALAMMLLVGGSLLDPQLHEARVGRVGL